MLRRNGLFSNGIKIWANSAKKLLYETTSARHAAIDIHPSCVSVCCSQIHVVVTGATSSECQMTSYKVVRFPRDCSSSILVFFLHQIWNRGLSGIHIIEHAIVCHRRHHYLCLPGQPGLASYHHCLFGSEPFGVSGSSMFTGWMMMSGWW